jgi:pimeloyl-ACP methyl ester carboxylesterase
MNSSILKVGRRLAAAAREAFALVLGVFVIWAKGMKGNELARCGLGSLVLASLSACSVQLSQGSIFAQRAEVLPVMSEDLARQNVEMTMRDGVKLRGWHLHKPDSHRLVLFFHGNGLGITPHTWSLDWLSQTFQASVVAMDQRGFGFSDGKPEIEALVADALVVHDQAINRYGASKSALIVVGQSMGTSPAIRVAAERRVTSLVLISALSGYRDFIDALDRQAPWYVSVEADESLTGLKIDPLRELTKVTAPTVFIHGTTDALSTPEVNARLLSASPSLWKRDCPVPGGHPAADLTNPLARRCVAELARDGLARGQSLDASSREKAP